jgi:hypothetical protein
LARFRASKRYVNDRTPDALPGRPVVNRGSLLHGCSQADNWISPSQRQLFAQSKAAAAGVEGLPRFGKETTKNLTDPGVAGQAGAVAELDPSRALRHGLGCIPIAPKSFSLVGAGRFRDLCFSEVIWPASTLKESPNDHSNVLRVRHHRDRDAVLCPPPQTPRRFRDAEAAVIEPAGFRWLISTT